MATVLNEFPVPAVPIAADFSGTETEELPNMEATNNAKQTDDLKIATSVCVHYAAWAVFTLMTWVFLTLIIVGELHSGTTGSRFLAGVAMLSGTAAVMFAIGSLVRVIASFLMLLHGFESDE